MLRILRFFFFLNRQVLLNSKLLTKLSIQICLLEYLTSISNSTYQKWAPGVPHHFLPVLFILINVSCIPSLPKPQAVVFSWFFFFHQHFFQSVSKFCWLYIQDTYSFKTSHNNYLICFLYFLTPTSASSTFLAQQSICVKNPDLIMSPLYLKPFNIPHLSHNGSQCFYYVWNSLD